MHLSLWNGLDTSLIPKILTLNSHFFACFCLILSLDEGMRIFYSSFANRWSQYTKKHLYNKFKKKHFLFFAQLFTYFGNNRVLAAREYFYLLLKIHLCKSLVALQCFFFTFLPKDSFAPKIILPISFFPFLRNILMTRH